MRAEPDRGRWPEPTTMDEHLPRTARPGPPYRPDAATLRVRPPVHEAPAGPPPSPLAGRGAHGTRIGPYLVLDRLGAGGMGEVLKVADPELDRAVALKVIKGDASALARAKFLREARITGQLAHPGIVPVHALGHDETGRPYFAMKEVEGEDLQRVITRQWRAPGERAEGAIPLTQLLLVFQKACDAVAFAHARGVIHRDLKPANIMVGEFGEVLVMDWGLAKRVDSDGDLDAATGNGPALLPASEDGLDGDSALPLTLDGTVVGTIPYMPPEQAEGRVRELDARADVYAFGAILYHLLTGSAPYTGPSAWAVLAQVLDGPPPRPRERCASAPAELEAVVLRAMARTQAERYGSVRELQGDVQAFLDGRPLATVDYAPWTLAAKWARRHRPAVVSALAAVALAILTAGWFAREAARERVQRASEARAEALALTSDLPQLVLAGRGGTALPPRIAAHTDAAVARARTVALDRCFAAAAAVERAQRLSPDDPELRALRRAVGERLGRNALATGDYALARAAFATLVHHGAEAPELAAWEQEVVQAELAIIRWRGARLELALSDIDQDLSRPNRPVDAPLLEDYVLECTRFQDLASLGILARVLEELAEKARAGGDSVVWTETERTRAAFACSVLAVLEMPEAVEPLLRWLAVVRDPQLVSEAAVALCTTRDPRAWAPVTALRDTVDPNSPWWMRVQRYLRRVPPPPETTPPGGSDDEVSVRVRRARARRVAGNLPGAIDDLTWIIERYPRHELGLCERAVCYQLQGDTAAAEVDATRAIDLAQEHALPHLVRSQVRFLMGNHAPALVDVDRALELDPVNAQAHDHRGLVRAALGDLAGAVMDHGRALELEPDRTGAHTHRGVARHALGDFAGAIVDHSRALELDPRCVEAFVNRGLSHRASGDTEAAIADFGAAIGLDPRSLPAHSNRGYARMKAGDLAGALSDLTRAIEISPGDARPRLGRGLVHAKAKRLPEAIADFGDAIERDPRLADAYAERGLARKRLGQPDAAAGDLRTAVELDPRRWDAAANLGHLFALAGRTAEARAMYERARAHAPPAMHARLDQDLAALGDK